MFLVVITLVIADLLARSYYQFTTKSIHKNLKIKSLFGLILGVISLLICNVLIISDLNIYKMLRQKNPNMNQIVRYFTDERPVQTPDGKKSLGYMRIQEMDTGNDNENMFFRDMMSHLTDLEHHISYKNLAKNILGVEIDKKQQKSNWLKGHLLHNK